MQNPGEKKTPRETKTENIKGEVESRCAFDKMLWDRLIGSLLDCTNSMANCFPGLLDLGLMCACGNRQPVANKNPQFSKRRIEI